MTFKSSEIFKKEITRNLLKGTKKIITFSLSQRKKNVIPYYTTRTSFFAAAAAK